MDSNPTMAPFSQSGGTQRWKRGQPLSRNGSYEVHRQHPRGNSENSGNSAVKVRRRRRISRDPNQHRNCKVLCGLLAAVTTVFAVARYGEFPSRRHPSRNTPVSGGQVAPEGLPPPESETARLRREVSSLEATLLHKKTLLGVAHDSPLVEVGGVSGGVRGGDRWGAVTPDVAGPEGGTGAEIRQNPPPRVGSDEGSDRAQRQQQLGLAGALAHPVGPPGIVAGEPMFGLNPVRQPLELRADLIREPVPLIVGGTDGSGTRGVVALLQRLKVPMVIEDAGTMDVHASPYMANGGWPAVVQPVIEWAHGAGYDTQDAPDGLRRTTTEMLDRLRLQMDKSASKLRPQEGQGVEHVSWGFKAPVSMLLVPFFAEAWGKAKFLHVVRDGRDIAFSGNQTPVAKFYGDTFPDGSPARGFEDPALKAVAMWNTWNVGLYDWAAGRGERGEAGLDYLLLHTEDLIDPVAKFAAIKDVAEFVGSPLSDRELCCIATEGSRDMGSHTTSKKDRGKVTTRFGKWKSKVEGNPVLSKSLHTEGERGLRLFGYEPERSVRASGGYQCAEEHDSSCPKAPAVGSRPQISRTREVRKNVKVPADIADTPSCVGLTRHVDFKGFDIGVGNTKEHLGCCEECRVLEGCTHFSFEYKSGSCFLKSGRGAQTQKDGLVSGAIAVAA